MRHFTNGCGQTFANKGLGYVPVGCGIGVAMSTASLARASVPQEMAEIPVGKPPHRLELPPPVPPSCPPGLMLLTQSQLQKVPQATYVQETSPPSTSKCALLPRVFPQAKIFFGVGKCDWWRINYANLLAGIQQAWAFHGPDTTARAIDSVLLGGELTVEYFPGKEQLVPLLRSIGGAGGDGAFLVNCARGPVG